MQAVEQNLLALFALFTLVVARVGGLIAISPFFGAREIPPRMRALLTVMLAMLITPLQMARISTYPTIGLDYLRQLGLELLAGMVMGLALLLLFTGLQLAGQLISQLSGVQWSDVLNPTFGGEAPVMSQLLFVVGLAIFATSGGHRQVMEALLDTFATLPPGQVALPDNLVETLTTLLMQSFAIGLRIAAATMAALLVTTLVLGLISRVVPQLHIMSLGLGLNAIVLLGVTTFSLGIAGWVFQEQLEPTLDVVLSTLHYPRGANP